MTERVKMPLEEFLALVKSQGLPIELCTFRCPMCKTLQCANDLILAGAGNTFDEVEKYLAFSCVGRWDPGKGCDWTLGGLFQLHELEVITEDGKAHPRFMPAVVVAAELGARTNTLTALRGITEDQL